MSGLGDMVDFGELVRRAVKYLVEGLVLAKQACSPDMKRSHQKGTILIIDGGIEKRKTTIQSRINLSDPSMISAFRDKELELVSEQIDKIIALNPTIVVCRDGIDDSAIRLLEKNEIRSRKKYSYKFYTTLNIIIQYIVFFCI